MDEVSGEKHFWSGVLKRESVLTFLANTRQRVRNPLEKGFTLTTGNPTETGSKAGVRIIEVEIPGRSVTRAPDGYGLNLAYPGSRG